MWSFGSIRNCVAGCCAMFRARTASTISSARPSSKPQHSAGATVRACSTIASSAAFLILNSKFQILNGHRNAHAAANAERGDAVLLLPGAQGVDERRQHARPAGANRMPERDCAAVHVDLPRIDAKLAR